MTTDVSGYLGGNVFNKYESKNPLVRLAVHIYLKRLFALLDPISPSTVLDVGGGEGYIADKIANHFGISVVCIEPNRTFISQHTGKNKLISYVQGSAYHIPKKDKSVEYLVRGTKDTSTHKKEPIEEDKKHSQD